jgi:very-short-patch-repair endonuclease
MEEVPYGFRLGAWKAAPMARNRRNDNEPRVWAWRDRKAAAPQTSLARGMRRAPTMAEKKLWWNLHRLSVNGSHFRRQVRLGRYIVDFASHKARLVIEVDGGQHAENAADVERSKFIEGQGYRVLRFWNNDVLGNIDGVLEVIQAAIDVTSLDRTGPSPPPCGEVTEGGTCDTVVPHLTTPHPIPPPQGGRESPAAQPKSHSQLSVPDLRPDTTHAQKRLRP